MKFRAEMRPQGVRLLHEVVRGLSRLGGGRACLSINPRNLSFAVTKAPVEAFVQLLLSDLFVPEGFILKSLRQDNISMHVDLRALVETMRWCAKADNVRINMDKRGSQGVLCFEMPEVEATTMTRMLTTKVKDCACNEVVYVPTVRTNSTCLYEW
eukprot:GHVS01020874.1.p1 GENE.GHVS01020874.1~~GHVS01020874.1.p1  ORF type:complete len:155 (+),score=13.75 GHVS01020874.1:391-855(+)